MRLETARLVIRTFELHDAQPWLALLSDPDVRRFIPPGPLPTLDTFQRALERRHTMERERGYAMWAVETKATGAFAGQCGLQAIERAGAEVELAYVFHKPLWNQGYATEAATAVLAYGLGPVGLDRVIAVVMPENVASCRVVEKAGMRYAGIAMNYDIPGLRKYVAEREWWSALPPG
jgi:RimJ/RimL family protein N-acetyltransferase